MSETGVSEAGLGFKRAWELLCFSELLSPETRQSYLDMASEAEKKLPVLSSCYSLPPREHWEYLKLALPNRDPGALLSLSAVMRASGNSKIQALPTTQVRQSLCAFMDTNPDVLDVDMHSAELYMPKGWQWMTVLGCGKTSVVHEFKYENQTYAVKAARGNFKLNRDFAFLTLLNSIDGIPKVVFQLGSMLALQPVGVPFTKENIHKYGLNHSLCQLVDILQAAHAKEIINRDVRMDNFVIAGSTGTYRFYIIDWGFASYLGTRSQFAGCLYTASDNVLQQLQNGTEGEVIFEAADDLVALVRCIWMFCREELFKKLKKLLSGNNFQKQAQLLLSFWKEEMTWNPSWKLAHENAALGKADCLKDWLRMVGECVCLI